MHQRSFADMEYEGKKHRTRREKFLGRMEELIPWERLEERIRPYYPKAGRGGRPYELAVMLRVHCVQLFYNVSDPGMEDMLYEIESVRRFVGLRLGDALPDETTILHFRHLLSASVGEARVGRGCAGGDQRALGGAGVAVAGRDDPGRDDHRRAEFDEEQGAEPRPGDASEEEGEAMAFRDEGAHRGGRRDGAGA